MTTNGIEPTKTRLYAAEWHGRFAKVGLPAGVDVVCTWSPEDGVYLPSHEGLLNAMLTLFRHHHKINGALADSDWEVDLVVNGWTKEGTPICTLRPIDG